MSQRIDAPLLRRNNLPFSLLKEETTMATRNRKQAAQQTETVEPVEQIEQEQPEEIAEQPTSVVAMRATLKAQGYKRCPTHATYLDRLPEAAQQPVAGQSDPAIRPLSEFSAQIAACKACTKLRNADHRSEARAASGKPHTNVARLVALMRLEDQLATKAKAIRATLSEDDLDLVEALYKEATTAK